jgi:hypothetical protein
MGYIMRRRPVSVIELAGFRRRAGDLLTLDQQDALIDLIAYEPTCGERMPGTSGLRKLRVARSGSGKRGGARVIYYFHDEDMPILLLAIYAKNEKGDLSAAEKRELATLVKEIVAQWKRK